MPATIPAHNLDAERAVLGCILLEGAGALAKAAAKLQPSDFYTESHRTIFRTMLELSRRGSPVDLIVLNEELRRTDRLDEVGGPAALALLVEQASIAAHADAYMRIVLDQAVKREAHQLVARIGHAATNGATASDVVAELERGLAQLRSRTAAAPSSAWPTLDVAAAWAFDPPAFIVDSLLPLFGVTWWGGPPKRYKSLLLLYICLAIAAGRQSIAEHFTVRHRPVILYVAREDGGSRLQSRRDDILASWTAPPPAGRLHFLIRPRFDLLNPTHVAGLVDLCRDLGATLVVLDTWTALSPGADPLGAKDQAALAAVVVELAEALGGAVVVVDHSRKNRGEGEPISSADIFGPLQKWAAAEHIVMLDLTSDRRRLEVFIEGKDGETRRCFLTVTPKGTPGEKFTYAGTVEEIADAQREKGNQNRDAVHRALCDAGAPQAPAEIHAALTARGGRLSLDTVSKHLRALVDAGRASTTGKGRATRYVGISEAPSSVNAIRDSDLPEWARS